MNLFKEHAVRDYAGAAAQIPVIDFGLALTGEPDALRNLAAAVRHACENVGFFYALNHGVPEALIDRAFAASRQFHALPLADKLKLRLDENNIGYLPINVSVQGASTVHKATRPNQNESFFVSHDRGPEHPDAIAGKPLRGGNQWPPGLPGIRADMMAYFTALAVRLPAGEWIAPPIIPGTFLINLGNILRRWSNDRFLSTPHGVLNESGTDRYSIAYFHSPNPVSVIECVPTCTGADNPARYPPAVYRKLVLEFYRANYFYQKGHRAISSARTMPGGRYT